MGFRLKVQIKLESGTLVEFPEVFHISSNADWVNVTLNTGAEWRYNKDLVAAILIEPILDSEND